MRSLLTGFVFVAGLVATPAVLADEDLAYLEACLAAAGGETSAARVTCFGQVSDLCVAGTAGTTADMTACAQRELTAWSTLLERTRADLQAGPVERVAAIDQAQTAWLVWRDARCAVYATFDESIAPPLVTLCLAETTAQRVTDLWSIDRGLIGDR